MAKLMTYKGPWKGVDVSMPENEIDPASFPQCDNFFLRAGELRSAPRLSVFSGNLNGSTYENIFGTCTFIDSNNVFHSCMFTQDALYQLNANYVANRSATWTQIGTLPVTSSGLPVSSAVFVDKLFFVNGTQNTYSWDGLSNQVNLELTGYGAVFIAELAAHILLISTVESNTYTSNVLQSFPQRIRWTPSGITNVIDPAINVGAGFNDLL